MAQSILGAVQQIQTLARAMSGIRNAPDTATESSAQLPFAVSFPADSPALEFVQQSADSPRWLVTVHTLLCFSRQDLAASIVQATPYIETFCRAIEADNTLAGTVEAVVYPITATFGNVEWNGSQYLGFKVATRIKVEPGSTGS